MLFLTNKNLLDAIAIYFSSVSKEIVFDIYYGDVVTDCAKFESA